MRPFQKGYDEFKAVTLLIFQGNKKNSREVIY